VLPAANRLRTSKEFELVTKTGGRANSHSLVLYFKVAPSLAAIPKVGLIVNSSIGGSVVRHRISRKLRHAIAPRLAEFPKHTQLVIRVLRKQDDYAAELSDVIAKALSKVLAGA
jgi:ribonuclease P protein component